jgi:hypothetical protein
LLQLFIETKFNMATPAKNSKAKASQTALEQAEDSLAAQTARFLAGGGKIQEIPLGVSGQVATTGPRHITLGKRHLQTQ